MERGGAQNPCSMFACVQFEIFTTYCPVLATIADVSALLSAQRQRHASASAKQLCTSRSSFCVSIRLNSSALLRRRNQAAITGPSTVRLRNAKSIVNVTARAGRDPKQVMERASNALGVRRPAA